MPSDEISAILQALERFSGDMNRRPLTRPSPTERKSPRTSSTAWRKWPPIRLSTLRMRAITCIFTRSCSWAIFRKLGRIRLLWRSLASPATSPINFSATSPLEYLPIILFNTCGGQFDLIKSLILNRRAEGYVRGSAAQALAYGVAAGQLPREEVLTFFSTLFTGDEAELSSPFWSLIADCILDLQPLELMPANQRGG